MSIILTKHEDGTATDVPVTLGFGELAVNTQAAKLWVGNSVGTPVSLISGAVGGGSADGQTLRWEASTASWDASSSLVIADSGNVGIGTVSPATALNVISQSQTTIAQFQSDDISNIGIIGLRNNATTSTIQLASESDDFYFRVGGSERMRIDSAGNVGIGTTVPADVRLNINGTGTLVRLSDGLTQTMNVTIDNVATTGGIQWDNPNVGYQAWRTSNFERMRIDASGTLLVGTTVGVGSSLVQFSQSGGNEGVLRLQQTSALPFGMSVAYTGAAPNSTTSWFFSATDTVGTKAEIRSNGGLANFSANDVNLSDRRAKKDEVLAGNYLDKLCAIPVKHFRYKADDDNGKHHLGVIAQDVEAVAPEFVDKASFEYQGEKMDSVYNTDLMFAMMKAIQELTERVVTLEAQ